jgi:hypothetical protein
LHSITQKYATLEVAAVGTLASTQHTKFAQMKGLIPDVAFADYQQVAAASARQNLLLAIDLFPRGNCDDSLVQMH